MTDLTAVVSIVSGLGGALVGAWAGIRKGGAEAEVTLGDGWAKLAADLRTEIATARADTASVKVDLIKERADCTQRIRALEEWRARAEIELDECRKHQRQSRTHKTTGPPETPPR